VTFPVLLEPFGLIGLVLLVDLPARYPAILALSASSASTAQPDVVSNRMQKMTFSWTYQMITLRNMVRQALSPTAFSGFSPGKRLLV